jgi:hypothetical protein
MHWGIETSYLRALVPFNSTLGTEPEHYVRNENKSEIKNDKTRWQFGNTDDSH